MKFSTLRYFLLLCFFISSLTFGYSQIRCSHQLQENFYEKVPEARNASIQSIKDWKEKRSHTQRSSVDVTIPVHVIIMHPVGQPVGVGDNLTPERIQSQIDVLNEDFPALNADIAGVPAMFNTGASTITFCLASVDPNGNPTDGVTRFASNLNYQDNQFSIMEDNIWDNSLYLNIFVTSTVEGLGVSPVPSTSYTIPPMWDAPTVLTSAFGGPGFATQTNYDLGRTAVHEIGHWLGLNHIWGPNNGGCGEDDGFDDTPTTDQPIFFCPSHPLPDCGNSAVFFMNFMDYVDDACMLAFSEDQVDYMHFIIEEIRPGLIGAHLTKCETVVAPDPILPTILSTTDESCAGASNGSVDMTATGGTPPYSYSIDGTNFQSTGLFQNLAGGSYTAVINDNAGDSATANFSIGTASQIFIEVVAVVNPCGILPNGSFAVVATGGNPGGLNIVVNQTMTDPNNLFSNLQAGVYTISATDSQNCIEEITFDLTTDSSSISIEVVDPIQPCSNATNGSFTVITTPSNLMVTINGNLTPPFDNLPAGDYTIVAEDAMGCTSELAYTLEPSTSQVAIDIINVVMPCGNNSNGSFQVETNPTGAPVTINQTLTDPDNSFDNLATGMFTIVALDAQGCANEMMFTLDADPDPFDPIQVDISYPSSGACETDPNSVAVTLNSNPNDAINSFELDNGMSSVDGMFTELSGGNYNYTVSNDDGCIETGSFSIDADYYYDIEFEIIEPSCPSATDGSIRYSNNTSLAITLEVSAGTSDGPSSYINIPTGTHTLTVYGEDNCVLASETIQFEANEIVQSDLSIMADCDSAISSIVFSAEGGTGSISYELNGQSNTTGAFDNLMPGNFVLTATDENNCFAEFEIEILSVDAPLVVDTNVESSELCFGETTSITINATGGAPPYEFVYNGIGQSSNIIQNVGGGIHTIEVISNGNCSEDYESQIEIIVFEALVVEDVIITDSECSNEGGFFEANIFDGSQPYYYILDQTDTLLVADLPRLEDGNHTIQVMDALGCTSQVYDFDITVSEPVLAEVNVLNHVSCYGLSNGKIELNIESNVGISSYDWNIMDLNPQQMSAGDYNLIVTNQQGCTSEVNFEITQPDSLIIETEVLTPAGNLSGSADFTMAGGTPPYEFSVGGVENEDGFFSLLQGDYTVDIKDANGCTLSHDFTILLESANEDIHQALGISISPNPTSDFLNVACIECQANTSYSVLNVSGKKLMEGQLSLDHQIDIRGFAQGFYLLVIESDGLVVSNKFLVL